MSEAQAQTDVVRGTRKAQGQAPSSKARLDLELVAPDRAAAEYGRRVT
jgi:hypothetical protein